MRLIDADKTNIYTYELDKQVFVDVITRFISLQPTVEAITVEQLLSILPNPYNETMEDSYSQGYEDGWNACLKAIKEELRTWKKENEID